ncbi:MAG: carboxypeptidase regulatory-like domain-containing protein [Armatimonadota bacterium]
MRLARLIYVSTVVVLGASVISAQTTTVTGMVFEPDGTTPAAGAEIHGLLNLLAGTLPLEATAAEDGTFELSVDASRLHQGLIIVADAEGYGFTWQGIRGEDLHRPLTLVLAPEKSVTGQVLAQDGAPIPDAKVYLKHLLTANGLAPPPIQVAAHTGPDGTFRLDGIPVTDALVHLVAEKPGYASAEERAVRLRHFAQPRFMLRPGCTISGRVVGPPEAVAGLTVYARSGNPWLARGRTETDEQGRWEIRTIGAGAYSVTVDAPEGWTSEAVDDVRISTIAPARDVDIPLIRGGVISGTVRDATTGELLPSAPVFASRSRGGRNHSTRTNAEGHYQLRVPAGSYEVNAGKLQVEVQDGSETVASDFDLEPPAWTNYVITVVDPDGASVAGANVEVGPSEFGKTDRDGRWAFTGRKGMPLPVVAREAARGLVGHGSIGAGEQEVVMALKPGGWATLRLVDPSGAPVVGERLACGMDAWTDEQGVARFGPLAADGDHWPTLFEVEQYVVDGALPEKISVAAGETVDLGTIVVDRAGTSIDGHVADGQGHPVAGCLVVDVLSGAEALTDEEGRYELMALPHRANVGGPYFPLLVAAHPERDLFGGGMDASVGEQADLVLGEPGSIAGRVVGADGRPFPEATVAASPCYLDKDAANYADEFGGPATIYAETVTDGEGRFWLDGLAPHVQYALWLVTADGRRRIIDLATAEPANIVDMGDVRPN